MSGLRVLIVDDERPARQKLRRLVTADPDVGAVFEASDGARALELILVRVARHRAARRGQCQGWDGFGVIEAARPRRTAGTWCS